MAQPATRNIEVRGARENNLKDVSVIVPKGCIAVFTGVSGSGKSSLVFDTIYAEAHRQLLETWSAFSRTRLPKVDRPKFEAIVGISPAIVIDQKVSMNNLKMWINFCTRDLGRIRDLL
jgi:excinuclease UvrABC ATPase subunit